MRIACLLAAFLAMFEAAPALASCVTPPPTILWSSPAQGEADVALDADLLLVLDGWDPVLKVLLDGRVLEPGEFPGVYDLGELEPSREYVINIEQGAGSFGGQPREPTTLTFTTGTRTTQTREARPSFAITGFHERIESGGTPCAQHLYANSCYDTGAPLLQSFEVAGIEDDALLWVIETHSAAGAAVLSTLPIECGPPRQLMGRHNQGHHTYVIHAVRADGSFASSSPLSATAPWSSSMAQDCAVSAAGGRGRRSPAYGWILLLGIALVRRLRN